ncbi:hypothetical protein [uncultured Nitrosomonas sp.]|uniref:hypothetical protein n=1 Tax=uncultured Nitrosomonas sp. TaxID=156424 RepID=UPI0025D5356D|nr:hypothetical protein [uncultured Nitrosomonas sp.]
MTKIWHQRLDLQLQQFYATARLLLCVDQHLSLQRDILSLLWQIPFRIISVILLCAGLAAVLAEHAKAAEITTYIATQVDIIPMGSKRIARAMNDSGDIVGTVKREDNRGPNGVIWKNGGQLEIIKSQGGGDYSTASGINNRLKIVGSTNTDTGMHAFRLGQNGEPVLLEMLPGDTGSAALAISGSGKVAGWSSGPTGVRAVIWSPAGEILALPALSISKSCRGLAINDNGDVAGVCDIDSGPRAVLWSGGSDKTALDLGTLPGDHWSEVLSINNKGDVVGTSGDEESNRYHAVLWPNGSAIKDLGTLPNQTSSKALAINNKGTVVGVSSYNSEGHTSEERAFVWTNQRGMQDLNDLLLLSSGFVLSHAIAISSHGIIAAIGHDKNASHDSHPHDTHELSLQIFRLNPQLDGSR